MCQGKLESNPTYTRANITMPDYQIYHRMDELLGEVDALVDRHPGIMRRDMMEATVDGYSTKMSVVSVSPGGFDGKLDEKLRILLNFGEHARELVTSELALRLLSMLGGEHNLTVDNRTRLAHILPHTVMKIIPMENVNGRVKVEAGDLCERKNGRGVDTNRNWKVDWGKKEKDYNPNEEYPVRNLLQVLNEQHCQGRCAVGSGGAFVGYLSHGTATDYIYDVAKVPIALTLEIFGDEKTPDEDCFRMFNPVSYNQLEEVLAKWSTIFFALLVNLPKTLSSMPSTIAATSWDISESSSLRPLKQFEYLYNGSGELKKLGRVWHGMDTVSEGLRTPDTEASLQYYLLFCLMLLIMSWFRCSRRYKRLFFYIRSVSRRSCSKGVRCLGP
uniref:Peptidase M14 domain-containing protein n=3 Tax=Physcomitrium patens TaxID=3218 RepID=A0A7I4BZK9_PHYPA